MFEMYRKFDMLGYKFKFIFLRYENLFFDIKEIEKEFKVLEIEYCIFKLKWIVVLEKFKENRNVFKDCLFYSYILSRKFILKCFILLLNK